MAYSITQQPTTPNVTYTNLVYVVSSSAYASPQFQYVMDVKQGGNLLTRIKQYPNPYGVGIFDPSRVLNDYLEYDLSWIQDDFTPVTSVQTFNIEFGEEYGSSPSSSIALTASLATDTIEVFPGIVDPNNGTSYNWLDSGSAVLLTDRPSNIPVSSTDIFSITAYNGTATSKTLSITGGEGGSVPAGEFKQFTLTPSSDKTITYNGRTITIPQEEDCNYDRVNFAFINNYGFWDYYGINLPIRKETSVNRQTILKPFVNYSSNLSPYNVNRRGIDTYNVKYTDDYVVTTPPISQDHAEWLTQLLESPEVFIQQGVQFVPIEISNSTYTHNTNRRGQKLFQYEIQYRYANPRQSR